MKPLTSRQMTLGVLIGTTLVLLVWDIIAATNHQPGDTVSEIVLGFAGKHPVLPFVLGILAGHLLWPQRVKEERDGHGHA